MKIQRKIAAFTIFEITVVLAIMSILITIITISLNRFNEQIKSSSEIHEELNAFYIVRSSIWKELYESDSLFCEKNNLLIYQPQRIIEYFVDDEILYRKTDQITTDLKIPVTQIIETEKSGIKKIEISFLWKGEIMKLSYLNNIRPDVKINHYFDDLK